MFISPHFYHKIILYVVSCCPFLTDIKYTLFLPINFFYYIHDKTSVLAKNRVSISVTIFSFYKCLININFFFVIFLKNSKVEFFLHNFFWPVFYLKSYKIWIRMLQMCYKTVTFRLNSGKGGVLQWGGLGGTAKCRKFFPESKNLSFMLFGISEMNINSWASRVCLRGFWGCFEVRVHKRTSNALKSKIRILFFRVYFIS